MATNVKSEKLTGLVIFLKINIRNIMTTKNMPIPMFAGLNSAQPRNFDTVGHFMFGNSIDLLNKATQQTEK